MFLPCPKCHKQTDSIKRNRLYQFAMFIGVAWFARTATYTACAGCMRSIIVTNTLVNIIPANVIWPVIFLIHAAQYVGTFSAGHDKGVLRQLGISPEAAVTLRPSPPAPRTVAKKLATARQPVPARRSGLPKILLAGGAMLALASAAVLTGSLLLPALTPAVSWQEAMLGIVPAVLGLGFALVVGSAGALTLAGRKGVVAA
ncbi:MAG: hypothetical protein U0166_05175 [Acidobacteriota bacterium]